MQRDMDLVRTILLRLENSPLGWAPSDLGIRSYTPEEVGYHAHIMSQEGLIEAAKTTHLRSTGPEALPRSLTWSGHEFLDLARDQDRWNRAKAIIGKVGGAPIAVWTKVLTDLVFQGVEGKKEKVG
jgi:hypothetical protein